MNPKAILNAALILQAREALQNAVMRNIVLWAPRVDDQVKPELYRAMDLFLTGASVAAKKGKLDMFNIISTHISAYRPNITKEQLDAYNATLKKFGEHMQKVLEADHPHEREKFQELSTPYQLEAARMMAYVLACKHFKDAQLLERAIWEWEEIAADWKRTLDREIPMPEPVL